MGAVKSRTGEPHPHTSRAGQISHREGSCVVCVLPLHGCHCYVADCMYVLLSLVALLFCFVLCHVCASVSVRVRAVLSLLLCLLTCTQTVQAAEGPIRAQSRDAKQGKLAQSERVP